MVSRTLAAVVTAGALTMTLSACGDVPAAGNGEKAVDIVAAFYPLQFVAERVGGDAVRVTNLAKPGAEPHDLELNPAQVGQIADAKLVIYLKGFQPAVDEAVTQEAGDKAFDAAAAVPLIKGGDEHGHEGDETPKPGEAAANDPHLWLDPTRLATVGDKLAERLSAVDADHAADYRARAATLRSDLEKLDQEYATGLKTCQRREIVTSHTAFGYLADRYKLEQIGITGITPEDEPSPQHLAKVAEEAREHKATTIFFETLVSPKVAETIAQEIGAQTAVLDPIEGLQPGSSDDYVSVMRKNLETLRPALGCT
jgi:zinc transport system substrate-binding protein